MTLRAFTLSAVLLAIAPASGYAVTVEDLVALSKAGLADSVLVAVIDADRTVFHLSPEQVIELKKEGIPERVIVKMLGSAREFGADTDEAPEVVIIGERPPAPAPEPSGAFISPFYYPLTVGPAVPRRPPRRPPAAAGVPPSTVTGFGRFINDGWTPGIGFGRFINDGWIGATPPTPTPVRVR